MVKENRLTLMYGREIELHELKQSLTYEGWLEGLPTVEWNNRHLERLAKNNQSAALIRPPQRFIDLDGSTYPFGTPATIPGVECIGRFCSDAIGERDPLVYSEWTIIWFQAEFAMPIDSNIIGEIAKLDWNKFATNHDV